MIKSNITLPARLAAFHDAPESIYKSGMESLSRLFPDYSFNFSTSNPLLIYFLSGGSERFAIEAVANNPFVILLAGDGNNAWAAATEVKARLQQLGVDSLLADPDNESHMKEAGHFLKVFAAIETLKGKKLGLIGNPSDWLVASGMEAPLLDDRLGIKTIKIAWSDVPDYQQVSAENEFLEKYHTAAGLDIAAAGGVGKALKQVVDKNSLDALTVECFPMVQNDGVTACLALSHFNDCSVPAGCEGDQTSIAGMMLVQAVAGIIPWMANLVKLQSNIARFAHCTAPTGLLEEFAIDTHFETGKGTAIAGIFAGKTVTIFRMNNSLDKAFIAVGEIIEKQAGYKNTCRTMIGVKLSEEKYSLLRDYPLGNHHLIIPGNHEEILTMTARIKGIVLQ